MARAKFDMGEFVRSMQSNVSNLDTEGQEQIEYIDLSLIDGDPSNFYALSAVEELADNIALLGLQQPLRVRPSTEDPARVVIVSGHRRRAALQLLAEEGRGNLSQVPCIREAPAQSAAMQELRMIFANSATRRLTDAELSRQAERIELLLYQLKEEGYEFPGRMRDQVAAACQVSAPKLARLKVIREHLISSYMALFEKNQLPEQTAYALARLPEAFQLRLSTVLTEPPNGMRVGEILQRYNAGWRWEPNLTCPDGKACKRGDAFLRRDCACESWRQLCGGQTCCLECDQAGGCIPCDRMCSKAKAKRNTSRDEAKALDQERKRANGQKYQEETQRHAKRLLRAIDAAGLLDGEKLHWEHYTAYTVRTIRQWAAGEFDDPACWGYPRLVPGLCSELMKATRLLGCSADFLLGLTDDLCPPAAPAEGTIEEMTASAESFEDALDVITQDLSPVHRTRWESCRLTPPEDRLILTYQLTNDGPVYRPAVWKDGVFLDPNGRKVLTDLQFTHWLEFPPPGSGVDIEMAAGQLVLCGWIPGGITPSAPCDIVADFCIEDPSDNTVFRTLCKFDGKDFVMTHSGIRGSPTKRLVRWIALPPVEEG